MKNEGLAKLLCMLSFAATILAAAVSLLGLSLWLAGTQWMLVAILLGVWSVFLKKS
jgi:hypothetical protein